MALSCTPWLWQQVRQSHKQTHLEADLHWWSQASSEHSLPPLPWMLTSIQVLICMKSLVNLALAPLVTSYHLWSSVWMCVVVCVWVCVCVLIIKGKLKLCFRLCLIWFLCWVFGPRGRYLAHKCADVDHGNAELQLRWNHISMWILRCQTKAELKIVFSLTRQPGIHKVSVIWEEAAVWFILSRAKGFLIYYCSFCCCNFKGAVVPEFQSSVLCNILYHNPPLWNATQRCVKAHVDSIWGPAGKGGSGEEREEEFSWKKDKCSMFQCSKMCIWYETMLKASWTTRNMDTAILSFWHHFQSDFRHGRVVSSGFRHIFKTVLCHQMTHSKSLNQRKNWVFTDFSDGTICSINLCTADSMKVTPVSLRKAFHSLAHFPSADAVYKTSVSEHINSLMNWSKTFSVILSPGRDKNVWIHQSC